MDVEPKIAAKPSRERDLMDAVERLADAADRQASSLSFIAMILAAAISLACVQFLTVNVKNSAATDSETTKAVSEFTTSIGGSPKLNGLRGNTSLMQAGTLTPTEGRATR